jgi:hypothetical protein
VITTTPRRTIPLLLAAFAMLAVACPIARSDDKAKAPSAAEQAAMMAEYAKAAAPGPEHQRLKHFAGEWVAEVKMFQPDGTAAGPPSKGVMHAKMILGDRYLQLNYDGEMDMGPAGGKVPFHGMGISGYDKGKKKYTSVWIDEMSTGMMISEGTCDGNVTTFNGTLSDSMSGKTIKVKEIATEVDKDHHKYELHMTDPMGPGDGKLIKTLEITYTRK